MCKISQKYAIKRSFNTKGPCYERYAAKAEKAQKEISKVKENSSHPPPAPVDVPTHRVRGKQAPAMAAQLQASGWQDEEIAQEAAKP